MFLLKKKNRSNKTSHRTYVLNNLLYEYNLLNILIIEILNSENKGKVEDLIQAIEICIAQKVNLINMSLGIATENEILIQKLKSVCLKAVKLGIVLVAAKHNSQKKSYPAAFDFVI